MERSLWKIVLLGSLLVLAFHIIDKTWPAENEFYWKGELVAQKKEGIWNLKKEDGIWTDLKEPNEIRFYDGLANGKRAFIIRILSLRPFPEGDTLALRYFYH